jgi:hypothetical protein
MSETLTENFPLALLTAFFGVVVLASMAFLIRDAIQRRAGTGLLMVLGVSLIFVAERFLGDGGVGMGVNALGLVGVLAGLGLRMSVAQNSSGAAADAHRLAFRLSLLIPAGLLLYGLTLDTATAALGFEDDALERWNGVWQSLAPLVVALGALPVLAIDRVLSLHPLAVPSRAAARAMEAGLAGALALGLIFPANYLASQHDETWDVAYFRTAQAGTSTLNIASTLAEPISITLFYPAGSDVQREIDPYFDALDAAGGDQLTVTTIDQALVPQLAEEMKIRENGFIAFQMGEHTERFKLADDLKKAKRDLRKLDSQVRGNLIKLTRGERKIYWMGGHGEASAKEKDDPMRKLNILKRAVFDAENLKVVDFGFTTGSTANVPDDAALVVLAAPVKPLMDEEISVLKTYLDQGGRMLVLVEPDGDDLTDLLGHIGVESGEGVLAHADKHLVRYGGKLDRVLLATNKFGSHESVKTLARNASQTGVVLPTSRWVAKKADAKTKVATLIRSFPDTWADLDKDLELDEDEAKKVYEMAVAVSGVDGPSADMRIVVVGDVNLFSDQLLGVAQGNQLFARDTLLWLLDDEEIAGEVESEEDVKIVHTRDEDQAWFLLTVLGMPMAILLCGLILIRIRRQA